MVHCCISHWDHGLWSPLLELHLTIYHFDKDMMLQVYMLSMSTVAVVVDGYGRCVFFLLSLFSLLLTDSYLRF